MYFCRRDSMERGYKVKLKLIADEHGLNVLHATDDFEKCTISNYNVSRPALQFAGFYDYFDPTMIQIIGKAELAYLRTLSEEEMEKSLDTFFAKRVAAVIICSRIPPNSFIVDCARKYDTNLLCTDIPTNECIAQIINTLRTHLCRLGNSLAVIFDFKGFKHNANGKLIHKLLLTRVRAPLCVRAYAQNKYG